MDPTLRALLSELFTLSLQADQLRVQVQAQQVRIAEIESRNPWLQPDALPPGWRLVKG